VASDKRFLDSLRQAFDSLSNANLGEFMSEREKYDRIITAESHEGGRIVTMSSAIVSPRHVALVATDVVSPDAARYALNTATRLDAKLDILTPLEEPNVREALGQTLIDWQLVRLEQDLITSVPQYTRKRAGLLCVVVDAADQIAEQIMRYTNDHFLSEVPWVFVTKGA
jgi:hypothetical protein